MRVLHVTPYFAPAFRYGGPPRSVLGLCRALAACGVQVEVFATAADGDADLPPARQAARDFEGLPARWFPRSAPRSYFRSTALARQLRQDAAGFDLIHVHGCWNFASWSGCAAARRAGRPFVVSPRGMLEPWSFGRGRMRKALAYRWIERPHLRAASALHATSEEERRNLERLGLGPPIEVIPNGIDLREFERLPSGDALRRRLELAADDFVVLFLGRVHPKKGLDVLAEAMSRLLEVRPTARLLVAGGGETYHLAELRSRFGALERSGNLIFLGPVENEARLAAYAAADAFALTSHSENFGLTIAEALAAGLPVVASRACPWPQLEAWGAGFWVENSSAHVAAALGRLAADPGLRRAMGESGRREVFRAFGWQPIGERMRALYERSVPGGHRVQAGCGR